MHAGPGARPVTVAVLLVLLSLAALGQRFVGIGFLLPHMPEPDGIYLQAEVLARDRSEGGSEYNLTSYPHLMPRMLQLLPGATELEPRPGGSLSGELDAAARPILRTRLLSACLSALLVPATYVLARCFLAPWTALFAAALAATSLLHVSFSQQGRPHAAAATFALVSVLASMRLLARRRPTDYALAAFGLCLSLGALQSGAAAALPLAAAHLLRARPRRWRDHLLLLLPAAGILVALWCFYPYVWSSGSEGRAELEVVEDKLNLGGRPMRLGMLDPAGWRNTAWILWSYDPVLFLGALLGGALALASLARHRRVEGALARRILVALAYALPYLTVCGFFRNTFERLMLQLVPYLAVLTAHGICVPARASSRALIAAILPLAALALPCWATIRLVVLRARPDSVEELARWMERSIGPQERSMHLAPPLELPLWLDEAARTNQQALYADRMVHVWLNHQLGRPVDGVSDHAWPLRVVDFDALGLFSRERKHVQAAARSLEGGFRAFLVAGNSVEVRASARLREASAGMAAQTRVFAAGEDPDLGPLSFCHQQPSGAPYGFLWTTLRARRVGPAVEVHVGRP